MTEQHSGSSNCACSHEASSNGRNDDHKTLSELNTSNPLYIKKDPKSASNASNASNDSLNTLSCVEPNVLSEPLFDFQSLKFLKTPDIKYTLSVNIHPENLLGSGRVSKVYKGRIYQIPIEEADSTDLSQVEYTECAVKLVNTRDEDAFELGITEACVLHYLSAHLNASWDSNIVQYYGIAHSQDDLYPNDDKNDNKTINMALDSGPKVINSAFKQQFASWAIILKLYTKGDAWSYMKLNKGEMGFHLFMNWAKQLSSALSEIHSFGIIHNDIKPHNIMISSDKSAHLSDFSAVQISKATMSIFEEKYGVSIADFYTYGDLAATVSYSAPELLKPKFDPFAFSAETGDLSKFGSSDIYSLGVSFYVMFFSGRDPFYTVSSNLELAILAKKGVFWEWEQNNLTKNLVASEDYNSVDSYHNVPRSSSILINPGSSAFKFLQMDYTTDQNSHAKYPFNQEEIPTPTPGLRSKSLNYGVHGTKRPKNLISSTNSVKVKVSSPSFGDAIREHNLLNNHSLLFFINGDVIPTDVYFIVKKCLDADYNKRLTASEIYLSLS